jgi:hypothetical protein
VDLPRLDADRGLLDAALAGLQMQWSMASHVVARGEAPEGIDAETLDWWRAAYAELQRRRWDPDSGRLGRDVESRQGDERPRQPGQ